MLVFLCVGGGGGRGRKGASLVDNEGRYNTCTSLKGSSASYFGHLLHKLYDGVPMV